jgi:hypothetical protein
MLHRRPLTAPSRRPRRAWLGLLVAAVLACPTGLFADQHSPIRVERAKTWVGIARVLLDVTDLSLTESALTGYYEIRVPLAPYEDDHGAIRLDLVRPLPDVLARGGQLTGIVRSDFGKTHDVECTLEPDGRARIVVTTDKRVLSFKTRFLGIPGDVAD